MKTEVLLWKVSALLVDEEVRLMSTRAVVISSDISVICLFSSKFLLKVLFPLDPHLSLFGGKKVLKKTLKTARQPVEDRPRVLAKALGHEEVDERIDSCGCLGK